MYKAAVISTAPYISTHIFFFKNLSSFSLYIHKHLDYIIRPAISICATFQRRGSHTKFIHFHTKLLQGGGSTKTPPGHTQISYNFIQYHTNNRPEPFTIKVGCCLILSRLDLGLSED
jgi:hypothetical protein